VTVSHHQAPIEGEPLRYHPRRLPAPTKAELARRGALVLAAFARRFAPLALEQARRARHGALPPEALARPLREAFEDVGGTFIKFGQILASSPGLFGEEISDEFRSCLDTGPVVAFAEVRRQVEDDLGCTLEEAYRSFDPDPIGRASIAVVHRAVLHDGRDVAVKVLRPGIVHLVATDLDLMEPLFELVVRQTGAQIAGAIFQQLDGFRLQIGEEMDLRNEARAMAHFRELTARSGLDLIAVPEPFPELSGANVLTMEFLDGIAVDDLAALAEMGVDPAPLIEQLIRGFFLMTVKYRMFHGDVHAGNLLLCRDGKIGVIDWGIVGRLDAETHWFLCRMLAAVLGDEDAWGDVTSHLIRTYGPAIGEAMGMDDEQLAAFMRSMVEPVLLRPFGEVSFAEMMSATQVKVAEAHGVEFENHSLGAIFRRFRLQRRIHKMATDAGGLMSDFDRGYFLLGKQLMYFERYGKLFLADVPILSDRAFIAQLLAEAGEAAPPEAPAPAPGAQAAAGSMGLGPQSALSGRREGGEV
jgi:predicted unusual protein kinase regulating ubiquinone biosynthesis (AarF/ABC1/UbiB family)